MHLVLLYVSSALLQPTLLLRTPPLLATAAATTALDDHPVLGPLAAAAAKACEDSTGAGTESSGTGRPEWGTWCDTDLFENVRSELNRCTLVTNEDAAWPALWEVAGGEAASATIRIAGGKQWDMLLRLFASPAGVALEERACEVKHADGVLALLRPLVGGTTIKKLRPSGEVLGVARALKSGDKKDGRAFLQLGGPTQRYEADTSTAALLEVVLRHETQQSLLPVELPSLADANPALLAAFRDVDAPPPPPPPSSPPADATAGGGASAAAKKKEALAASLSSSVGGLEAQLEAIVRRVLASRADPVAAKRLGVSHVRGILLSGPPGCGKTLLARELARSLGAREPQVVNGPEILDKFVGEAEKRVRELFAPAEAEWEAAGDASELHVIVLDEMDAIARKRGSSSGDTSGVRDSVVNQLLAKMDGVNELSNVLVIGLTNRPELLDDALLRPGRLEVQLEVSLPDVAGRRDILRIHTRAMRANGALAKDAACFIDADDAACSAEAAAASQRSLAELTEHFSGAELAGLVRSAASYALGRAALEADGASGDGVAVRRADFEAALSEVKPARGRRDEALARRCQPHGVDCAAFTSARDRLRALLTTAAASAAPSAAASEGRLGGLGLGSAGAGRVRGAMLVPESGAGSDDAASLAAWAGCQGAPLGELEYVRLLSLGELVGGGVGPADDARCQALAERFAEARSMRRSMLILEDVDLLLASSTSAGPSPVLLGTLRSLMREPLEQPTSSAGRGGEDAAAAAAASASASCLIVLATLSDPSAAAALRPVFADAIAVPLLQQAEEAADAMRSSPALAALTPEALSAAAEAAVTHGPASAAEVFETAERRMCLP